jgi:hypothetical protein
MWPPAGAFAKNLHTLRGSIYSQKSCPGYRLPFMASETELTIPAPLRHKKKVRRYENNRKNSKKTGIYQDLSIKHYMVDFEDCGNRGGVLRMGLGFRVGGFGVGLLLANTERYCILPRVANLSDWVLLVHFYAHLLIN